MAASMQRLSAAPRAARASRTTGRRGRTGPAPAIRDVACMAKKSVGDLGKAELEGKKVFVRADLNVPLDGDLNISDDTRVRAAIPTLKYLVENGAKVLLTSHLGRPKSD